MTGAADLAATHAAAFAGGEVWSEAAIAALLAAPGAILAGDARAFVLGRVVADEAEILTLATRPGCRRQGLARAALAAFEAGARQAGAATVFLEVDVENTAARALYLAAGYAPGGLRRGYYRHADGSRSDALVLRKPLRHDAPQRGDSQDSG
ncbi:MAG: GNAT family N-acetyltransferase [Rubellimicrobium sp.]|nr:GNAT family N-acetyltransferase [Rubellimicrobium sp.]